MDIALPEYRIVNIESWVPSRGHIIIVDIESQVSRSLDIAPLISDRKYRIVSIDSWISNRRYFAPWISRSVDIKLWMAQRPAAGGSNASLTRGQHGDGRFARGAERMANNNPRPAPGRTLAWRPASLALATATAIATAITAAAYSFCPGAGAQCLSQGWPRAGDQVPAAAGYGTRSLSHIAPPHAFSTDDSESAQIPVTAMDLGEKIGHEQAQNLPSLES